MKEEMTYHKVGQCWWSWKAGEGDAGARGWFSVSEQVSDAWSVVEMMDGEISASAGTFSAVPLLVMDCSTCLIDEEEVLWKSV